MANKEKEEENGELSNDFFKQIQNDHPTKQQWFFKLPFRKMIFKFIGSSEDTPFHQTIIHWAFDCLKRQKVKCPRGSSRPVSCFNSVSMEQTRGEPFLQPPTTLQPLFQSQSSESSQPLFGLRDQPTPCFELNSTKVEAWSTCICGPPTHTSLCATM